MNLNTSAFKIATLNLWRYYEWENRKETIVKVLSEHKPDILCLQEVQLNDSFHPISQALLLARELGYTYSAFVPTMHKKNQRSSDSISNITASHGLALLSKYPILELESVFLTQKPDDPEPRSILFAKITIDDEQIDICNVHFSNSDIFAASHLQETLEICKRRDTEPIILGDFNLYDLAAFKNDLSTYSLSSDVKEYMSYPKDQGTLDYIIVPKTHDMSSLECLADYVSDHRMLIATIKSHQ